MISVVYAAGLVLVVALAVLVVDWPAFRRHLRPRRPTSGRTVTAGIGWRVITDSRLEVSSTQVYPNGTTQIWLKRRPAA